MSILRQIAKGTFWTAGAQWTIQILQVLTSIMLARMLSPKDYGLVSMTAIFTGFVALFANLGFGHALVQRKEIDSDWISVALTTTAGVATFLFIITWLCAPFVSDFYHEPRISSLVRVAGLGLILSPLNAILDSLLTRAMDFKRLAYTDIICTVSAQVTSLVAAFLGFGVWSLVLGSLVFQAIRMPILVALTRYIPRIRFEKTRFLGLFAFGSNILGFNFLNYIVRNLDNLIIGRFLGPAALGYYDLAYQIMLKPLQNVSSTLGQPLFAALSTLQDNKPLAAETYRKVVMTISLITFPMMLGLATVAPDFILTVFGEKWAPAIPVLQILCIVGAMQSVGTTVGVIYTSFGRTDVMLRVGLVSVTIVPLAFLIGVQWGITGVALSYAIVTSGLWIYTHKIANTLLGLRAKDFWKTLVPAAVVSGCMVVFVSLTKLTIEGLTLSRPLRLSALAVFGALVYVSLISVWRSDDIVSARTTILNKLRRA